MATNRTKDILVSSYREVTLERAERVTVRKSGREMSTTGTPVPKRAIKEGTSRPAGADFERRRLQRIIATGDAAAITLAFALVTSVTVTFGPFHGSEVLYTVVAGAIGLASLRAQG